MTNYRLKGCAIHDQPQFRYCFDCGAPLVIVNSDEGERYLTCSSQSIHFKAWFYPHDDPENTDCPQGLEWD
jgi:hypothetical protein